jgi:hypothetical protein
MLAFESLTPQELLKEIAEYLRQEASRENRTAEHAKTKRDKFHHYARANSLAVIANDLDAAGIIPAQSILRTEAAPKPKELWVLKHDHRHGTDVFAYRGGKDLTNEEVAARLGVDYEPDRDDEYLEAWQVSEPVPDVDLIPTPEPDEDESDDEGDEAEDDEPLTAAQIDALRPGDTVRWTDPDGGLCSRYVVIKAVERIDADTVRLEDVDGSVLEACVAELSEAQPKAQSPEN